MSRRVQYLICDFFRRNYTMSKHILKELPDLIQAQVITEETAQRIKDYYDHQPGQSANRLFIVFGILGSLLVGMGIVLIIAHNWDTLPKIAKLAVGFFPFFIGQAVSGYVILKKTRRKSLARRRSSISFLCHCRQHFHSQPGV